MVNIFNIHNGPQITIIYNLPPNSPILVWREGNTRQSGSWEGLYLLFIIKGETCTI